MNRIHSLLRHPYTLSHAAVILLHLPLFLLALPIMRAFVTPLERPLEAPRRSPVRFEFVERPQQRSDTPPEESLLLSDRHAIARDVQQAPFPTSYLPYSEGFMEEARDARTQPDRPAIDSGNMNEQGNAASTEPLEALGLSFLEMDHATDFSRLSDHRGGWRARSREEAVYGRRSSGVQLENRQASAVERGDFQLSTYAWDFAPYMSDFKKRVESNIFPPPAWDLGIIEGRTVLNIRVLPDGSLGFLKVAEYEGSELLRDTNLRAVRLSAPFRPLPDHFPDAHLDVRYLFIWKIIRHAR